jgi:hypothetical protein
MTDKKLIISPKTKIGELIESYPELENVLMSLSPLFEKLKNPILRKTVARVATIQQVAAVGGIPVEKIVNRLRSEIGQETEDAEVNIRAEESTEKPSWFDENHITVKFDASPLINSGGSPMSEVLEKSNSLRSGDILELQTPFVPAPVLDILKKKNFLVWTIQKDSFVISYIKKAESV